MTTIQADSTPLYPHPKVPKGLTASFRGAAGQQVLTVNGGTLTPTADQAAALLEMRFLAQDGLYLPIASYTPNFPAATLATGPSLYEPLDGYWGHNSAVNRVANANLIQGSNMTTGTPGPLNTLDQGYAVLNGTNAGAFFSNYSPFVIGSVRTYAIWVNRTDTTTLDTVFGNSVALNAGNLLLRFATGSDQLDWFINYTGSGAATGSWTSTGAATGSWHWLVLVVDDNANTSTLYVDGVNKGAQAFGSPNTAYNASPGVLWAGVWRNTGQDWYGGGLAHFTVWERGLSAAEVAGIFAAR